MGNEHSHQHNNPDFGLVWSQQQQFSPPGGKQQQPNYNNFRPNPYQRPQPGQYRPGI